MRKTLAERVADLEAEEERSRERVDAIFEAMRAACEAAGIPVPGDAPAPAPLRIVR